jgi:hypothetical protein
VKRRHQTGNKKGNPAYRTPAVFRHLNRAKVQRAKARQAQNSTKKSKIDIKH